jgi:hypothetical protein
MYNLAKNIDNNMEKEDDPTMDDLIIFPCNVGYMLLMVKIMEFLEGKFSNISNYK